jgi:hypothetical protein
MAFQEELFFLEGYLNHEWTSLSSEKAINALRL